MAELNYAVSAIWKLAEAINAPTSCSSAQSRFAHYNGHSRDLSEFRNNCAHAICSVYHVPGPFSSNGPENEANCTVEQNNSNSDVSSPPRIKSVKEAVPALDRLYSRTVVVKHILPVCF